MKTGKWSDSEKSETVIVDSFYEFGNIPSETEEKSPQMCKLINSVQDGMGTAEIIGNIPSFAFRKWKVDALRQLSLAEQHSTENRKLIVTYICGATGAGKMRGIFEKHNPRDICRITNNREGRGISFDGYYGQDVLVNASLLIDKGIDIKRILSWMGHAHFSTTADIYAHLRKDTKKSG